jgi:hypothetical protein
VPATPTASPPRPAPHIGETPKRTPQSSRHRPPKGVRRARPAHALAAVSASRPARSGELRSSPSTSATTPRPALQSIVSRPTASRHAAGFTTHVSAAAYVAQPDVSPDARVGRRGRSRGSRCPDARSRAETALPSSPVRPAAGWALPRHQRGVANTPARYRCGRTPGASPTSEQSRAFPWARHSARATAAAGVETTTGDLMTRARLERERARGLAPEAAKELAGLPGQAPERLPNRLEPGAQLFIACLHGQH